MNEGEREFRGYGDIVVGDIIGSYNAIGHGAQVVVTVNPPGQKPSIEPWPTPIHLGPYPFPGLLGREEEIHSAFAALQAGKPVEVYGEPGVGKTAFLRHLAYHPNAEMFPDGVVYLPARGQPLEDLQQFLYEAFYESQPATKATAVQLRHLLRGRQALILLDDVTLDRSELASLLEDVKGCAVVLAAPDRHLLGVGRSLALKGLSTEDALAMVERELGDLPEAQQAAFQALCGLFDGHPLRILQAVTNAHNEGLTLTDLVGQVDTAAPGESLVVQLFESLSVEERRVVALLAVFGDVPLRVEHLAALANISDIETVLEGLVQRNIVQTHSPSYSLTGSLAKSWANLPELDALREKALSYFVEWAEQNQQALTTLLDNGDAVRHIMDWATKAGRWEAVLRLAQAMDASFMLSGRWGAWHSVARNGLRAAHELGNRAAQAWALHQLGSRALCLGDTAAAQVDLADALNLWEEVGDQQSAEVTRRNLGELSSPSPVLKTPAPTTSDAIVPKQPPQPPPAPAPPTDWFTTAAKLFALASVSGLVITAVGAYLVISSGLISLRGATEVSRPTATTRGSFSSPSATPTTTMEPTISPLPTLTPVALSTVAPTPTSMPARLGFYSDCNFDKAPLCGIFMINADGSSLTRVVDEALLPEGYILSSYSPWSPDGRRIAFASGDGQLYVASADGTNIMPLTGYTTPVHAGLVWSPDGRRIAFTAGEGNDSEIYTINSDGSDLTRLTENLIRDLDPIWSPDGQKIAVRSMCLPDPITIDMSSNPEPTVLPLPGPRCSHNEVGIHVLDTNGNALTHATLESDFIPFNWLPDSQGLVLVYQGQSRFDAYIYVMDIISGDLTQFTNGQGIPVGMDWSPDGHQIALAVAEGEGESLSNSDIYLMNADGTDWTQLTNTSSVEAFPVWSPDGRRIAFVSGTRDLENSDIYAINADGNNLVRITQDAWPKYLPHWLPQSVTPVSAEELPSSSTETPIAPASIPSAPTSGSHTPTGDSHLGRWTGYTEQGKPIAFIVGESGLVEAVYNLSIFYAFDPSCPVGEVSFSSVGNSFISSGLSSSFVFTIQASNATARIDGEFTSNTSAGGTISVLPMTTSSSSCPLSGFTTWRANKQ
jgi:Tol biopolymer transport system component